MSPSKKDKIIRRRRISRRGTQKSSPFISIYDLIRRFLRFLDRNLVVFAILVVLFLFFAVTIRLYLRMDWPVDLQLKNLNPDAQLYYSLAQNLVDGKGYYDTLHKNEIVPSIGHPALLTLFCVILKFPPTVFAWIFFMLSFILLAVAVRVYCKSNTLSILSLWLFEGFFFYIYWYAANVESSIIFSNLLIAAALAAFYRTGFSKLWAIISGIALFIHIIIRPLFLFPTHLCLFVFVAFVLYYYIRKRSAPSVFVSGWLILLLTAECLLGLTYAYSYHRYNDSRLVTGTYGIIPLYAGNNTYLQPKGLFETSTGKPEELFKMIHMLQNNPSITWQQRHKILMQKVVDYWKQHPTSALTGWWWRFRQFLGICSGNFSWKNPLTVIHTFSSSALLALIFVRIAAAFLPKKGAMLPSSPHPGNSRYKWKPTSVFKNSLGLIFAALFLSYSAIHALFAYVAFRYASVTIPLLVVADVFLLFEVLKTVWESKFTAA
jgi:hypothetical protein